MAEAVLVGLMMVHGTVGTYVSAIVSGRWPCSMELPDACCSFHACRYLRHTVSW